MRCGAVAAQCAVGPIRDTDVVGHAVEGLSGQGSATHGHVAEDRTREWDMWGMKRPHHVLSKGVKVRQESLLADTGSLKLSDMGVM